MLAASLQCIASSLAWFLPFLLAVVVVPAEAMPSAVSADYCADQYLLALADRTGTPIIINKDRDETIREIMRTILDILTQSPPTMSRDNMIPAPTGGKKAL